MVIGFPVQSSIVRRFRAEGRETVVNTQHFQEDRVVKEKGRDKKASLNSKFQRMESKIICCTIKGFLTPGPST